MKPVEYTPPEEQHAYSVSQVTRIIKATLEEGVPPLWVSGEISNLARPRSGHIYLTLKDASSQLSAVLWRHAAARLRFEIADGLQVRAFGRVTVYEPRGQYQLIVDKIEPVGVGALELAFRQLHARLDQEGLFAEEHKKPIPFLPTTIGIITSATGAAIQDMLNVITTRFPPAHVILHPVRVQGKGAAGQIARAIELFNRMGEIDVMIVGRGGGSLEDLWAFNEEIVARAVYASAIPVISAVGHEIDICICDLAADLRALTPTDAGQKVVPVYDELMDALNAHADAIARALHNALDAARKRLQMLAERRVLADPLGPVRQFQQRLDELSGRGRAALRFIARHNGERVRGCTQRLRIPTARIRESQSLLEAKHAALLSAIARCKAAASERVQVAGSRLGALSPLGVLARGYSITTRVDNGRPLINAEQVQPNTRLQTRLHHGSILSTVTAIPSNGGT